MNQPDFYQTRLAVNPRAGTSTGTRTGRTAPATETMTRTTHRNRRTGGKMVLFGAMSIASYVVLFANETLVTQTYTLGGWYAACPVLTAFFFSFVHGAFASNLLSFVGLEAKKSS